MNLGGQERSNIEEFEWTEANEWTESTYWFVCLKQKVRGSAAAQIFFLGLVQIFVFLFKLEHSWFGAYLELCSYLLFL